MAKKKERKQEEDNNEEQRILRKCKSRVDRAKEIRKGWELDYNVEEGESTFINRYGGSRAMVNLIASTIKTERPNLFFQSPTFYVRPKPGRKMPAAERITRVGEGVLSAIAAQDDHLKRAGQLALQQAFFRVGVLKVVYDPRMEPNPAAGEIIYKVGESGEPLIGPNQQPIPQQDPLTGQTLTEPAEVLTDEVYRWAWVDAASMLFPDEGPDMLKWTWIGEEIVVPLEDAKKDERFRPDVREQLVANRTANKIRGGREPRRRTDDEEELFEYIEYYDIRKKRLYIWADGQDHTGFLHNEPVPKWIDNDPYAILVLGEPIIGPEPCPWPVPVVRDWLLINEEYNLRRSQITEGAKRSARKILFEDGAFPDEEEARKALQDPGDMIAIRMNPGGVKQVFPITDPDLSGTIYKDVPLLLNDFRMTSGTTGARQADPSGDTATEATLVERAANLRESDAQEAIIRWMGAAGRKMFQCIKATLTLGMFIQLRELDDKELMEYAVRVYQFPPEIVTMLPGMKEAIRARLGQQKWLQVTRDQLNFEADVTIVPGTNRPANLDMERRQWLEFLRVIGAAPQLILSRELLRYTAEKFGMHDDRLLDELSMMAQKMIQVSANQAGRNQGGSSSGASPGTSTVLAGATGGSR